MLLGLRNKEFGHIVHRMLCNFNRVVLLLIAGYRVDVTFVSGYVELFFAKRSVSF